MVVSGTGSTGRSDRYATLGALARLAGYTGSTARLCERGAGQFACSPVLCADGCQRNVFALDDLVGRRRAEVRQESARDSPRSRRLVARSRLTQQALNGLSAKR